MEPELAETPWARTRRAVGEADRFAVGSRRRALERLRGALRDGLDGPILITGEPGSGKRWLARRLVESLPAAWQTVDVELSAALDGLDLLRLAGGELGLTVPDRLAPARLALAAGLRDEQVEGRSWLLVVDEAQRAGKAVWEELQVLANRRGRPGGFEAVILLGRTELVRDLSRPGASARERLGRGGFHLHLPPMDLDEAREYLAALTGGRLPEAELEAIHRDAMGNPGTLRRLTESRYREFLATASRPASSARVRPVDSPRPGRPSRTDDGPAVGLAPDVTTRSLTEAIPPRSPSLIPARPPIRLEEGLVEVGWEGDLEAELTRPEPAAAVLPDGHAPAPMAEPTAGDPPLDQRVEDRYAALQAWAEWSRNRERSTPEPRPEGALDDVPAPEGADQAPGPDAGSATTSSLASLGSLRAEPPHDFAPYSPLFSRLRHTL